jgi:CysZ protein
MHLLIKTIRSLKEANLFKLMFACAVMAVIIVSIFVVCITWITTNIINFEIGWVNTLFNWVISIVYGIGGWFMLPAFTVIVSSIFQEKAINQVETVYYPESRTRKELNFWTDLLHDIKFTFFVLFLNLLILPLYFLGIGFALSILLNSYLLGREFFESSAGYHLGKQKAKELGQQNKFSVYSGGFAITVMTLIPLLNLFVPIIAIVLMVHVYHGLNSKNI